jgi:Lrp/AsnC family transcriptional regulator, leucine-responsive regulatory protein
MSIDQRDKKLLYHLSLNSRMSLESLGKILYLSKNSVKYRIKRLEKIGVIKNYYTVIDIFKLGYICIRCYITYQNISPEIKYKIINHFKSNKNVCVVSSMTGPSNLTVIFWVKKINEFQKFWLETYNKYGYFFNKQNLSLYYEIHLYPFTFLNMHEDDFDNKKRDEIIIGGNVIETDQIDFKIMKMLAYNSRIPIKTIANKLDISIRTAHYRIIKLKKMDIIRIFTINIDFSKLDFKWFKVDVYLFDNSKKNNIIHYLKNNPNMTAIDITTGFSDLELEFHVKDIGQLDCILDDLTSKFNTSIKYYSYFNIKENYKYYYFPEK